MTPSEPQIERFPGRRFHTALSGRVSWYCVPEREAQGIPLIDVELLMKAAENVGWPWTPDFVKILEPVVREYTRLSESGPVEEPKQPEAVK